MINFFHRRAVENEQDPACKRRLSVTNNSITSILLGHISRIMIRICQLVELTKLSGCKKSKTKANTLILTYLSEIN